MERSCTHDTDALESEDGSSEEEGKLVEGGEGGTLGHVRQVLEDVVECDGHSGSNQQIGHHRERSKHLQVAHQIQQNQRHQHRNHVYANVQIQLPIVISHLEQQNTYFNPKVTQNFNFVDKVIFLEN